MITALECGHIARLPGWPDDSMQCHTCMADFRNDSKRRVVAIETREWKVTCHSCRYARWTGQDKDAATVKSAKHFHDCSIDYLQHPDVARRVKRDYVRVKRIVVGSGTPIGRIFKSELPDEPPF